MGQTRSRMARMARASVRRAGDLEAIAIASAVAWVSFKQKLVEKPNLYWSCHCDYPFTSLFEKHFHLQQSFKECNVGVVFIWRFSFTSPRVMMELVRMVREAKRQSDFKILPVMLDVALAELEDPAMQSLYSSQWDSMELGYPAIIKAGECAAAYEYIRSCECMVNTGLKDIEFLNLVFDRVCGLISAERNTENLKGNPPPISLKDSDTVTSSKIHKVKEKIIPTSMMLQSTYVDDPDLGGERKNKSAVDLDNDKGDVEEEQIQCPLRSARSHDSAPKSQDDFQMIDALQLQLETQRELDHVERDEICDTTMRIDNLEGANDPHGNMEYDYESFKDQLYEDIKRIDCIEEIAIDHDIDTMILLHSEDIVILSFFDEKADMFEFYFKNREDMASIVGVGLEHASVILDSGKVTIKEIIEEDWNERWRSVGTNSCEKRILFKMKAPKASNAHEGLIHLDVELSSEKPLLWELTKYFSLRESIGTFVTKDIYAEYAQGVGTSSSTTSLKNQGEGSVVKGTWTWLTRRILNGGSQENENGGSTSNQIEERVMEDGKKSATIVELELLEEGLELKDEEVTEPFLGTITSNLLFEFINDGGDRKDEKEIHITIGHVSFRRGRNKNGKQSPWYHDYFQVMFGLLDEDLAHGELKRMSFKRLAMKSGMDSTKTSFTHGQTRGAENMINGDVSFKPYGVGVSGGCQGKSSLQNSEMTGSERGTEISNNYYTEGGLALSSSDDRFKIVCDYTVPEVLSLEPLPSRHFHDHHVMFQGTWLPMADEGSSLQFVEYTLQATRNLLIKGKGKGNQQKYTKTILVNHLMTHLDGKTYKLRERKTSAEGESKSILTESRSLSPFQWSVEPLVEIKDPPSEVTNATIEHVDQHQANNQSTRNSSRMNRLINRGLRMVGRDRSTGSGSSSAETSVPESRQEVNGTSNPTRASSMRWSIG